MKYVKKAGYIVATIFFLVFTLGPFVWTFVMAITPKAEMFSNVVSLLPSHITWSNFQNLFSGGRRSVAYFTGLKNSLRAVIVTICIGMPIALVSAYTLSRMEFPGRKIIKNALLITMVIPVMATIIPLYKMFSAGHMLDNTFWLSMVYVSSYLPMATWMIINYFSTIPKELEEAAHIDGCSRGIFLNYIAIVISDYFVSVTDYVPEYMEPVSDSAYISFIYGYKTYGDCCI